MILPNLFGIFIFSIWPFIVFWLFKKYSIQYAIFLSTALAPLLLPAGFMIDGPLIPPMDRSALTSVAIMFMLYRKKEKNPIFKSGVWNSFFIAYLLAVTTSTLLNQDPIETNGMFLRNSTPYDVLSNIITFMLAFMPFFFGRNFFNNPQDTESMFKTLATLAVIYSIPMLYELKMSPQLHNMFYGYYPSDFIQQVRGDGFRAVVFVGHGLALAFWFVISTIAAIALYKAKAKFNVSKLSGVKLIIFLVVVLMLCKTVSTTIYLIFAALLIYFISQKKQILLSLLITMLVMVYPINSVTQTVKYSDILDFISEYSEDRSASMKTRFDNEERLVERALERPYFGWSGWGRARVYAWGRDITITDGKWIIEYGQYGAIGFIFSYLLLIYPIYLALKCYKYIEDEKQRIYFPTLAIILAIGVFDSVPNSGMMSVHLLLAGALLGQSEHLKKQYLEQRRKKVNW